MSSYQRLETDHPVAEPSPVFSKVNAATIAGTIAAAITPFAVRKMVDWGLPVETEDARRVLVFIVTAIVTAAATFAGGYLKAEPVANVQRYLAAKRP